MATKSSVNLLYILNYKGLLLRKTTNQKLVVILYVLIWSKKILSPVISIHIRTEISLSLYSTNCSALKNVKSTVLRSNPFRVRRLLRLFVDSYEYISTYKCIYGNVFVNTQISANRRNKLHEHTQSPDKITQKYERIHSFTKRTVRSVRKFEARVAPCMQIC